MRVFRLYPEARPWWPFVDYGALLDLAASVRPTRVLEFGPGGSTLAIVEGWPDARIDTCESDPRYVDLETRALSSHRNVVVHPYAHTDPLSVPPLDSLRYDLAFVDGPVDPELRGPEIVYAWERTSILACHDYNRPVVRRAVDALRGRGPVSVVGGVAVVQRIQ